MTLTGLLSVRNTCLIYPFFKSSVVLTWLFKYMVTFHVCLNQKSATVTRGYFHWPRSGINDLNKLDELFQITRKTSNPILK